MGEIFLCTLGTSVQEDPGKLSRLPSRGASCKPAICRTKNLQKVVIIIINHHHQSSSS